ncbi:endonuclease/exonuclease/phosphatase family protein [Actinomadura parmotrematis]|uniref:Endonuclease/exonuclease/phosphatase n=1 Tax=Actinomadura parmotrematis TaxID=2864039 RepID=A0ABS7FVW5_9ACTN|nr:endonuclease/exonuclease/phosphatase family protein [Actinomadura parmotrematis]MBW8484315.1 endonuclease/exonuclease/phosphatase [Actinomadura parmotrematis]
MVPRTRAALAAAVLAAPAALGLAPARAEGAAPAPSPGPVLTGKRVHDVQGAAHVSPLAGRTVAQVPGVVTAVTGNGFWMQDPQPDRDPATSEGVFVFTRSRPAVAAGDAVAVDGQVSEYRPDGPASAALGRTEIDATAAPVRAHGQPLPAPTLLGPGGRTAPGRVAAPAKGGAQTDAEAPTTRFDAAHNALDFYESLEGMRVRVQDAVAVGPTRYGEVPVLPGGGAGADGRSARGGVLLRDGDANPERLLLDDVLAPLPALNVGDRLPGAHDGVLDYAQGAFRLLLATTPVRADGGLRRETARPQQTGELAVATASMDGLSPDSPASRFRDLAGDVVAGLGSPDLITVSGLQDNSGTDDDGTVAADQTVAQLISAISEAGGPAYDWRSVAPADGADGGPAGGNNRVGFLFRTDRGLSFADRQAAGPSAAPTDALTDGPPDGGPATVATQVVRGGLTLSPGRIAPGDPAWAGTRKPLAGVVTWQGRRIVVVANHWYPRTSDDQPVFGRYQPPRLPSEWRRDAQARVVAGFVRSVTTVDRDTDVIVAGDLNERDFAGPLRVLTRDGGLRDTAAEVPAGGRYTAVVDGNAQVLDHVLLSPGLARRDHDVTIVHRNAEFADRAGDRDPTLVRIDMDGEAGAGKSGDKTPAAPAASASPEAAPGPADAHPLPDAAP